MTSILFTLLVYSYLYVEYDSSLAHAIYLPAPVSFPPSPPSKVTYYGSDVLIYLPQSNILLHTLMLFLWHRPRARHRFAPLTRTLMSCATVNLWAGGCVGAFYTVDTAMWIAGWWFVGIPVCCWN